MSMAAQPRGECGRQRVKRDRLLTTITEKKRYYFRLIESCNRVRFTYIKYNYIVSTAFAVFPHPCISHLDTSRLTHAIIIIINIIFYKMHYVYQFFFFFMFTPSKFYFSCNPDWCFTSYFPEWFLKYILLY